MTDPNSKGYWRRNEIEGLKVMLAFNYNTATDPEIYGRFQEYAARLRELRQIEARALGKLRAAAS